MAAESSDPTLHKEALVGQKLGKCRIEALIGEGKTSVVFRAEYEPLHRTVAVKVLQEHLKKFPAVLKVFQQEGRAVAALDHENVLKIYDVGEDRGRHYLVLELLEGCELLDKIVEYPKGEFPVAQALEYVRQAAAGLTAAHRKNLVHRDIKPQNLFVEPDGKLKIVDFGLAAEAEGAFSGGRLGTPHYMSPEQCRGEMAGTASDIYALGVTLFHMLVGQPPYAGRTTTEEIIAGHLDGKRLEPEKLRPGLSKGVADLVRRMTRMDPDSRPSAEEIRDALSKTKTTAGRKKATVGSRRGRVRSARRRARAGSNNNGLFIAIGVVLVAVMAFFVMKGGGDAEESEGNDPGQQPDRPAREARVPEPENKPVKPKGPPAKLSPEEAQEVKKALITARAKEKAEDWTGALQVYQWVLLNTPVGSEAYREAEAAALVLKENIDAKRKGREPRKGKRYLTTYMSQEAGREFAGLVDGWNKQLLRMRTGPVLEEMQKYVEKTREDSAERGQVELEIRRAGYVDNLLKACQSRAHALTGGKEFWATHDYNADGQLMVVGADAEGIRLKHNETGTESQVKWESLAPDVLVGFLDAVRAASSGEEALWLGYFCQLHGDDRADQYFDFALQLDDSKELAAEIRSLRGP